MTDLVNTIVTHEIFGNGKVINVTNNYITVLFDTFKKEFVFPEVFKDFLSLQDSVISEKINALIKAKEKERQILKEKQDRELKEIQEELIKTQEKPDHKSSKKRSSIQKTSTTRCNIAFKCNYCDGGESSRQMGYDGVCSDKIISYNIKKQQHTWCSDEDSACQHYHNGDISRKELDHSKDSGDDLYTVCYESQMLRSWKAFAGMIQNGENKGKPLKLKNVHYNSLALLTTRLPSEKEGERIIFGVFMVDDIFEGDDSHEGYVSAKSDYKIKITPKEAQTMKFWNYYFNPKNPESIRMGSGLFRYLNDEQAIQILRDLVKLKEKTPEAESAKCLLDHFCQINQIDINKIPKVLMGALQRQS